MLPKLGTPRTIVSLAQARGPQDPLDPLPEDQAGGDGDLLIVESSRLLEHKEKEHLYKDNYSLLDELILCFRCLLD